MVTDVLRWTMIALRPRRRSIIARTRTPQGRTYTDFLLGRDLLEGLIGSMDLADDADYMDSEGHVIPQGPPMPKDCIARVGTELTDTEDLLGIIHGDAVRARTSGPTGLMNLFGLVPLIHVAVISVALALMVALLVTRGPLDSAGSHPTPRLRRRVLRDHCRALQTDLTPPWAGRAVAMGAAASATTRPTSPASGSCRGCARLPGCISHTSPIVPLPSEEGTLQRGQVLTLGMATRPRRLSNAAPPPCRAPTLAKEVGARSCREHRVRNPREEMVQTVCDAQFVGVSTRLGRREAHTLGLRQFEGPLKGLGRNPSTSARARRNSSSPETGTSEGR